MCPNNNRLSKLMNIKAAFIQGNEIEWDINVKQPAELKKERIIWKLEMVAYGLCNAPWQWYFSVKEELCKPRSKSCQLNKALFRWHVNGHLESVSHAS